MTSDEQAIRELLATWMSASKAGDTDTVIKLMSDDVVFMVPGRDPFGKEQFAQASRGMQGLQIEGTHKIVELQIVGDWAWLRAWLRVVITPPGSSPMVRSGYTLTILKKGPEGSWRLARDANLLAPENTP